MASNLSSWYDGKHIFITGSSGFMGKVLVEKLLRSCSNLSRIYLLVRNKRNKSPIDRIEEFLNAPIFQHVKNMNGLITNKIQVISGDLFGNNLSISDEDRKALQENVSVVFHMAANVRFDQSLDLAVSLNTGGTLKMLDLAKTMKKLEAFVHVSTTYCHCDQDVLEEKIYRAPHDPRALLNLTSWLDKKSIEQITPALLKNHPNTYAYTKCLSEELILEYSEKFPIAIARPSTLIASWKEPIPGWIDNINGPTGLMVAGGKGVLRSMHCNENYIADLIPVDIVINSLIIIARELGMSLENSKKQPLVVNLSAGIENSLSWGEILNLGKNHLLKNPFSICLWYPGGSFKKYYTSHVIAVFFCHTIPAYIIDLLLILLKKKPFMINVQKRVTSGLKVLQYYTTRKWIFKTEKMKIISSKLNKNDRDVFYTDMSKIDWNEFMLNYVLGARKYCVGDGPETIPKSKKLLKRLYYLDLVKDLVIYLFFFTSIYVLFKQL